MKNITLTIIITLAAFSGVFGQSREPARGFQFANSYSSNGFDVINVSNGNVMVNFPLASLPKGRGTSPGFVVTLQYNSKLWNSRQFTYTDGLPPGNQDLPIAPTYFYTENRIEASDRGGWRLYSSYQLKITDRLNLESPDPCRRGDDVRKLSSRWKVEVEFPDGTTRQFVPVAGASVGFEGYYPIDIDGRSYSATQLTNPANGLCYVALSNTGPSTGGTTFMTTDGSRLRLFKPYNSNNWKIYAPDGTIVENDPPDDNTVDQRVTDRNGNKVEVKGNVIIDSVGRSITFGGDGVIVKGVDGNELTTTVTWGERFVNREYRMIDMSETIPSGVSREGKIEQAIQTVESITLPTQLGTQVYEFDYYADLERPDGNDYTSGFGELKSMTIPSQAVSEYNFDLQDNVDTYLASEILANSPVNRELNYSESYDGSTTSKVDVSVFAAGPGGWSVTNPDGTGQTDTTFNNSTPLWNDGLSYKSVFPGGAKTERVWKKNLPYSGWNSYTYYTPANANAYVKTEFSTIIDASGNPTKTAIKDFTYDKNGNVTLIKEYDYVAHGDVARDGNGNPTGAIPSGATLMRQTVNTYYNASLDADSTSSSSNTYENDSAPRLLNLLKSTEIRDASNVVKSRSEFIYDYTDYSSSNTKAGNLIETRVWDSTKGAVSDPLTTGGSGNSISTFATYDTYGNVLTTTDANNVVTKYTYGNILGPNGNVSGLYPTQTELAYGTSLVRTTTATYDFYTGVTLSITDEDNDVTSSTEYDHLGRPTMVITGDGSALESWTQTQYYDDLRYVVVKSDLESVGDGKKVATQFYDQLGRVRLSKTLEDASTQSATNETDGIKVQMRYGVDDPTPSDPADPTASYGSLKLVSNPYRAATSSAETDPTMGWTMSFAKKTGLISTTTSYNGAGLPAAFGGSNSSTSGTVTSETDSTATTVTDQAGKLRRSITNGLGQLVRVDEPNSSNQLGSVNSPNQATNYTYNTLGKMVRVEQGSQNRYFMYDSLGRTLRIRQPEQEVNTALNTSGDPYNNSWTGGFTYDNNGNVLTTTDAKGTTITNTYDALNRPLTRTYNDSPQTATVTNTYGTTAPAIGKLIKVSSSVSETQYSGFDVLGRLTESKQITPLDGETISTAPVRTSSYQYNLSGALIQQTYPSGRVVETDLDASGDIEKITGRATSSGINHNFATAFSYLPDGKIASLKLGNGLWEAAKVNSRLQVTEIAMGHSIGDGTMMKLNYEYGELQSNGTVDATQNAGNIAKQTVTFSGLANPFVQTYKYDSLDRITEAIEKVNGTQTWKQTFGFDRYGNRDAFYQKVGATELTINSTTLPSVEATTNRFSASQGFSYDKNGNITADPMSSGRTFVFNGDNKQTEVKNSSNQTIGTYYYDGNGKRVKKVTNAETTVFVYDGMGKIVAEYSTATPPSSPTVNYTATDQLGSPRVLTNAVGEVVSRRDFLPFGEELFADTSNRTTARKYSTTDQDSVRQRFTGYQRDTETSLDFAEARMYQNQHGRFTAVDPLLASGKSADPQTFNRYVYTMNRPMMFTDPTGLQAGDKPEPPKPIEPPKSILDYATLNPRTVTLNDGSTAIMELSKEEVEQRRQIAIVAYNEGYKLGQVEYKEATFSNTFVTQTTVSKGENKSTTNNSGSGSITAGTGGVNVSGNEGNSSDTVGGDKSTAATLEVETVEKVANTAVSNMNAVERSTINAQSKDREVMLMDGGKVVRYIDVTPAVRSISKHAFNIGRADGGADWRLKILQ